MSDLIIHIIGIITLSCGSTTQAMPDPCAADLFPKKIEMIIPDGRFNAKVCKSGDAQDPTIEPHEAFIRIRGARASTNLTWPGAIQCDDDPKPCVLYPVVKRTLSIDGVSSGPGTTIANLDKFPEIRWSNLFPTSKLPALGKRDRLATMTIANGTVTYAGVPEMTGAIGATITVKDVADPTVIHANSTSNDLTLKVPANATIDILNVPRYLALSKFSKAHVHDDCDHFFLHYLLAETPPDAGCPFPKDGNCPHTGKSLGMSIACSNSNYP